MKRRAEIYVEATNVALRGIPAERVRFHTCYGINEGPRLYEASFSAARMATDYIQVYRSLMRRPHLPTDADPATRVVHPLTKASVN
jgi:hypothetical protein